MNNKSNILPDFDVLAPLETFEPNVFISTSEDEQKVCGFILSLGLAYNDFKNLIWAYHNLEKCYRGADLTAYSGQYAGFYFYIIRLLYSSMKELFKLIENKAEILQYPLFQKTLKLLSKKARDSWESLVDFSVNGKTTNKELKIFFEKTRHKITYHLSPEDIMKGYCSFFKNDNRKAYISRSNNLPEARFYFADAAVQEYIDLMVVKEKKISEKLRELIIDTNLSLYEIVTKFINIRCPYYTSRQRKVENSYEV